MDLSKERRKRLLSLLKQSRAADQGCTQFGSDSHQYKINPPLTPGEVRAAEVKYGFRLPEDYFWFLTEVGNGGAGPNYGLYPFGTHDQTEDFPRLACPHSLDPKATPAAYEDFIAYYEEDCDNEEYDRRENELWQGLLTIGTAGCSYDMMLVITGADRGRILHVDRDRQRPYFSPDASFLDWYERWLTETASGCQMRGFTSRIGGDADTLCGRYPDADETEKNAIVHAMYKFPSVAPEIVKRIYSFFETEENAARKSILLFHLSRLGYAEIDRLLRQALTEKALCEQALSALYDRFQSQQIVNGRRTEVWSPELDGWYADILAAMPLATSLSPDTGGAFYSCTGLLLGCSRFKIEDVEQYFHSSNFGQRSQLFYDCAAKPMPRRFVELYFAWLQENLETRNYHLLSSALSECLTIAERSPTEKETLSEELARMCLAVLRDFTRVPPPSKDSYIRNNVYQTLEKLGKNQKWVNRNR